MSVKRRSKSGYNLVGIKLWGLLNLPGKTCHNFDKLSGLLWDKYKHTQQAEEDFNQRLKRSAEKRRIKCFGLL
jgi:hypothetical protein